MLRLYEIYNCPKICNMHQFYIKLQMQFDIIKKHPKWVFFICRRPDSNRHAGWAASDFESDASTNFATPAFCIALVLFYSKYIFFSIIFIISFGFSAKIFAPFLIKKSLSLNPHSTLIQGILAFLAVCMSTSESPI